MKNLFSYEYFTVLFVVFLAVFFVREIFTYRDSLTIKYIFTPMITILVLGFVVLSMYHNGVSMYRVLILSSLVFAIVADVLLMIVETNLLRYGIIYFLTGHLIYIAALSHGYEFRAWNIPVGLVLLAVITFLFMQMKGKTGGIDIPVFVYMLVIATMVFFAYSHLREGVNRRTVCLVIGASLFMTSDCILAINAFLIKVPHSTVWTWATYAPAQFLIATSCYE